MRERDRRLAPFARICLIGAESTGKTELARELSASFVPEFARDYALRAGRPLGVEDVDPIARGQIALIEAAQDKLVVLDTDLLSTVVYARYYYGSCPTWIETEARARLATLYLWLDVDVPWIGDAARDATADRRALHDQFGKALREFGANYVLISGSWEERKQKALDALRIADRG